MAFGVLDPKDGHHVPGTVNLDDQATSDLTEAIGRSLKHATGRNAHIVLVPQPSDDPNDPLNWPLLKRNLVFGVIMLGTAFVGIVPGPILNAGIVQVATDLHVSFGKIAQLSGYLTLALGAASPLVSALARKYGKRPLFVGSSAIGVVGCLVAEFAPGYNQLLAGRVLQGLGSSAYESLCLSVISDLYFVHERGFYVSIPIFLLGALSNGVSIIGGVIITNLGWKYNFHILLAFLGFQLILVILFCPETTYNRSAIYNIDRVGSQVDLDEKQNQEQAQLEHVEKASVTLGNDADASFQNIPAKKTFLQDMALYNGTFTEKSVVSMGIASVAVVFNVITSYNVFISGLIMAWFVGMAVLSGVFLAGPPWTLTSASIGYVSTGPFIGGLLASSLMAWISDPWIKFMTRRNKGIYEPEFRLILAIPGTICTVAGLVGFGTVIDKGLSVYVLSFLWGLTLFGMCIVASVTSAYALDAMPSLAVENFIFNVTFKNFFFYGITLYVIPWYQMSGPLELFGTLAGITAALMSLTIPMYIWGCHGQSSIHERTLHAHLHELRQQRLLGRDSGDESQQGYEPDMIVYHPENPSGSSRSRDPTVKLGECLPSTRSHDLGTESSEAGQAELDPVAANSVQAILISQTTLHNNNANPQNSASEYFVHLFDLPDPTDDDRRQPETVSLAGDGYGILAQSFTTQPANSDGGVLEATDPTTKLKPSNSNDKIAMDEESSRKLAPPLMHGTSCYLGTSREPENDQRIQSDWGDIPYETLPMDRDPYSLSPQHSLLETGQPRTRHGSFSSSMHDDPDVHMSGVSTVPQTEPNLYCQPNIHADSSLRGHTPLDQPVGAIWNGPATSPGTDAHDIPYLWRTKSLPCTLTTLDESAYAVLLGDLARRISVSEAEIDLPPVAICQAYISSYAASFNPHLPIIHFPTWRPISTPSPLTLAICSIGALYRRDHPRAWRIYNLALRAAKDISYVSDEARRSPASQSQQSPRNTAKIPIWYMQTKLLLSYFSIMSGDAQLVSETLQNSGFYIIAHKYALDYTSTQEAEIDGMSWPEWVEHEAWRRALGASFILSTLTMVLYDVYPGLGVASDFQMQPIANEDEWSSSSPEEWRKHWSGNAEERKRLGNRTLRDILADIMMPQPRPSDTYSVSSFSAYVLMHAVVVHIWQRSQISEAVCEPWRSFDDARNGDSLTAALWNRTLSSLARCRSFLLKDRTKQSRTEAQLTELWLPFDYNAILCIAYARLYRPLSASLYLSFTDSVQSDLFACAMPYVMENLERNPSLSKVIAECLDGLKLPSDVERLLVGKKPSFKLGVEHTIAGFECALLVTKWTHHVEVDLVRNTPIDPNELKLFNDVKGLLVEAGYDLTESISVAAGVARTWSWYLKDTWFWGIMPRMGDILEQLAKAFEQVRKTNRRQSIIEAEFGQ
ncbi:hypothetical protein FNAPI_8718 [Fusarium napiforme]|uniref:Major facilitator superfamily (MFS) profile domain-containing protein n=1 Tax=Fusarium napiforme TaxID=42672 RepID=A0A8H5N062_9HYPO|nr:hypothetical protein FNAPI_8718 [Fusarium napiforme]